MLRRRWPMDSLRGSTWSDHPIGVARAGVLLTDLLMSRAIRQLPCPPTRLHEAQRGSGCAGGEPASIRSRGMCLFTHACSPLMVVGSHRARALLTHHRRSDRAHIGPRWTLLVPLSSCARRIMIHAPLTSPSTTPEPRQRVESSSTTFFLVGPGPASGVRGAQSRSPVFIRDMQVREAAREHRDRRCHQ